MKMIIPLIFVIILTASCTNPFSARDPEAPLPDKSSDIFDQPITHETVLSNLRYSLIQKNSDNYMNCLIDTALIPAMVFKFVPDQSAQIEKFRNWGLTDEQNYLRNVYSRAQTISFEYLDKDISFNSITSSEDSVQSSLFRYELSAMIDSLEIYTGKARMKLVKNANSLWAIYYWEDHRDDSNVINRNTWSVLKANNK
jgi:hypothetical protein